MNKLDYIWMLLVRNIHSLRKEVYSIETDVKLYLQTNDENFGNIKF